MRIYVLTDRQTDRQTDTDKRMDRLLREAILLLPVVEPLHLSCCLPGSARHHGALCCVCYQQPEEHSSIKDIKSANQINSKAQQTSSSVILDFSQASVFLSISFSSLRDTTWSINNTPLLPHSCTSVVVSTVTHHLHCPASLPYLADSLTETHNQ